MEVARRALRVASWTLVGLCVLWLAGHLMLGDGSFLLVAWHLPAAYLIVAIAPALGVAAMARDKLAFGLGVCVLLWWAVANGRGAIPSSAAGEPCLSLVYANVLMVNDQPGAMLDEVFRSDPDLVYLAEYSHQFEPHMTSWAGAYPEQLRQPEEHSFGHAVLSKRPATIRAHDIGGVEALEIRTTCDGQPITVIGVHVLPPYNAGLARSWHAHLDALGAQAETVSGPLAIMGDLNATRHLPSFGRLLDRRRLRSAHADRGVAWTSSWPNGMLGFSTSIFRLDHLLLSDELVVHHIEDGVGPGADHKPIIAEIGLAR